MKIKYLGLLMALAVALAACTEPRNKLEAVKRSGEITVLTRNGPTSYYEGPDGRPAGIEYDMAKAFADYLGVKLRLVVIDNYSKFKKTLTGGKIDFVAAGLTITEERKKYMRFSPPYQTIYQQVIYRRDSKPPRSVRDLVGRQIEVVTGTSYTENLRRLKKRKSYRHLKWVEVDKGVEELLQNVWSGLIDLTIADSNIMAISRQYYPELKIAFNISGPDKLAWAFPLSEDQSLYRAAAKFMYRYRKSGNLARLKERYYGATTTSYFNLTIYQLRVQTRLPLYQTLFEEAGKKHDLDWRLLAAVGYQESYWDPRAVSPTGVRGLMQLTSITAKHMGVKDRLDPAQSIYGGARYLRKMIERLPSSIKGKDRVWFALAAYNIGFNHLQDARIITRKLGGNPNSWRDVKKNLPLLTLWAWYSKTKYGYARGYEPVTYVTRIRSYYDVLVKIDRAEQQSIYPDALEFRNPAF